MPTDTIIRDEDTGLEFRWNGAHTVNIFANGEEIDMYSFGDFAKDTETFENFAASVQSHLQDES